MEPNLATVRLPSVEQISLLVVSQHSLAICEIYAELFQKGIGCGMKM